MTRNAKILVALGMVSGVALSIAPWAGQAAETAPTPTPAPTAHAAEPAATPAAADLATARAAAQKEVVLAQVGDLKITAEQFMQYIKRDTQLVLKSTTDEGRAEVLHEMIVDRLLQEGMQREGLLPKDHTPTQKDYVEAYQSLAKRYFPKSKEVPSEEVLYKYYQEHQESFGIPAMVRISQIQFRVPVDADEKTRAEIKAKADGALKRLKAGESFSTLASELTENPQAKVAGGDLGFLQSSKYPWLQKSVAGLQVGEVSVVLESPVGYEILLLQDKRDAMLAPYANVRDNVIGILQQEAQAKAREQYAWKLAKEVGVTVEQPELKSAVPATLP